MDEFDKWFQNTDINVVPFTYSNKALCRKAWNGALNKLVNNLYEEYPVRGQDIQVPTVESLIEEKLKITNE